MNDLDEVLETTEAHSVEVPVTVKVLAIISYIAHGILVLMMLAASVFFGTASKATLNKLMMQQMDGMISIMIVMFFVLILLSVLSIIGAAKMHVGKKVGFIFYAIGSGILGLLFLMSAGEQFASFILALTALGLVAGFGTQLKHLK